MKPVTHTTPIIFEPPADGRPYLGAPSVVEQLVRELLSEVVTLRGRQLRGESIDYQAALGRLGAQFQDTFYGQNPAYAAFAWNHPSQLGRSLVERAGLGGEAPDAVLRLAAGMVDEFVDAYLSYESAQMGEPAFRAVLERLVARNRDLLLGLPVA